MQYHFVHFIFYSLSKNLSCPPFTLSWYSCSVFAGVQPLVQQFCWVQFCVYLSVQQPRMVWGISCNNFTMWSDRRPFVVLKSIALGKGIAESFWVCVLCSSLLKNRSFVSPVIKLCPFPQRGHNETIKEAISYPVTPEWRLLCPACKETPSLIRWPQ